MAHSQRPLVTCTALLALSLVASILLWSSWGLVRPGQAARSTAGAARKLGSKSSVMGGGGGGKRGDYGPGFYNHSGCLYVHIGDLGRFEMTTADDFRVNETLELEALEFESSKSRCLSGQQSGKLTFAYKLTENKRIGSITVALRILPADSEGYWEVSQANLTITRADIERKRTFPLRTLAGGIYAGSANSYSCSELVMSTLPKRRNSDANETRPDPMATVSLPRFQLQPFSELKSVVFAPSRDCSSWLTIPGLMGLVLILFMILVTILGVALLKGIETNDFKFNREGLQFTQGQMETNKTR